MTFVRHKGRNGYPCDLLGRLVTETERAVKYRCRLGLEAYIPKPLVHLEPCPCCPDHGANEQLFGTD